MKLIKSGVSRNRYNFKTLVNTELAASWHHRNSPKWEQHDWHLFLRVMGRDGTSNYDYNLNFSADELALLVEAALTQASEDVAIHAHAKAIGAFIREVLDEKNKPDAA
jgi:hypothetical protein